jgi:hypothetical protein
MGKIGGFMKRRLFCLLLSAVLLMGLFAGCSKKITVEANLEDMELDGPEEWKTGEEYEAELIPDDGYILPEKITVKVSGSKLSSKDYEYDPEDGDLTIPGEFVTGDIKISGDAEEITLLQHMMPYADKILLALDTTAARLDSYGGEIGLNYIFDSFIPALQQAGFPEETICGYVNRNCRQLFAVIYITSYII